jgi:hypothetical protein
MKVIIYTANINGYDKDYSINITNFPLYRISVNNSSNPRLLAREIKIKPYEFLPDHDYSIWIDSNFEMINPSFDFNYDIVTWKHPERDCIYEEGLACIRLKKDIPEKIFSLLNRYRQENYPEHNGLLASGFLIRKNSAEVRNLCEDWWNEVNNNSIRDQLSFNYIASKHNLNILYKTAYEGFRKLPHKHHK